MDCALSERSGSRRRVNANREPDTRRQCSSWLDRSYGRRPCRRSHDPAADAGFLRRTFGMALGGIRDDLAEYADVLADPGLCGEKKPSTRRCWRRSIAARSSSGTTRAACSAIWR